MFTGPTFPSFRPARPRWQKSCTAALCTLCFHAKLPAKLAFAPYPRASSLMSCRLSFFHIISSHLMSSYLVSSRLISCLLSFSHLFSADHNCSHLFSCHLSFSHLSQLTWPLLFSALLSSLSDHLSSSWAKTCSKTGSRCKATKKYTFVAFLKANLKRKRKAPITRTRQSMAPERRGA